MRLMPASVRYVPPAEPDDFDPNDPARFVCRYMLPEASGRTVEFTVHVEVTSLGADEPYSSVQERAAAALRERLGAILSALE